MQKERGQHTQSAGNDYDGKLIERRWRLVVVDLRVQRQERPAIKKEQCQTQKKENALKIALAAVAENHHHPKELQQRAKRAADKPDVDQQSHEPSARRILRPAHLQYNRHVQDFSCTT
jgi:hypothetical protein